MKRTTHFLTLTSMKTIVLMFSRVIDQNFSPRPHSPMPRLKSITGFVCFFIACSLSGWTRASGYSLDFETTSGYVEVPYDASLNPNSFSVSAWVNVDSITGAYQSIVTSRENGGTGIRGYSMYIDPTGKWHFWTSSTPTGQVMTSVTADPSAGWVFLTGTFRSGVTRLYLNGQEIGVATGSSYAPNTTGPMRIGDGATEQAGITSVFPADAQIDEVAIWDTALSHLEIQALYNNGNPLSAASNSGNYSSAANLQAYYKMDGGTGTSLTDHSANSNTGTLINMANNDWLPFDVTQSKTAVALAEGGAADSTYSVNLTQQPFSDVSVAFSSADPGAVSTTSPLTFTAANWATAQTVTLSPVNDDDAVNESVAISHTLSGGGYTGASVADITVSVVDNDTQGITLSSASSTLQESGTGTFTAALDSQPTATVTIALSSSDSGAATVSPSTLTFTTADWATPQTITITGVADADTADESVTVSMLASGGDYAGESTTHLASIIDPLTMSITATGVSNGDTTDDASLALTFTANEPTTDFVETDITLSGGTLSAFTQVSSTVYTATFTPTAPPLPPRRPGPPPSPSMPPPSPMAPATITLPPPPLLGPTIRTPPRCPSPRRA